jgi:hypothetical protein
MTKRWLMCYRIIPFYDSGGESINANITHGSKEIHDDKPSRNKKNHIKKTGS